MPVVGKITYDGGEWPAHGEVALLPVTAAEGEPIIPAVVTMEKDGSFVAESTVGAGLIPGKYRVGVECWKLPPDESRKDRPLGVSYVANKYRNSATSGLEFEIQSGHRGRVEVAFNVPK